MAFLFVDRLVESDGGSHAEGRFTVPRRSSGLPPGLVAEAVGQLAAWATMARARFRTRPVAALAREVLIRGDAPAGATIRLGTHILRCDQDAVLYDGCAEIEGRRILELHHCLGPMLPMEEFDDPAGVREHYLKLRAGEPPVQDFGAGIFEPPRLATIGSEKGGSLRAELRVPEGAPFFADHFPRKAVYPATLLLDAQTRVAAELTAQVLSLPEATSLVPVRIRHMKVRMFTLPGEVLAIEARIASATEKGAEVIVSATREGRRVATARVDIGTWAD